MKNNFREILLENVALKDELFNHVNILDNAPVIIFINEAWYDGETLNTINVYANKYGYEYTGYTREICEKMGVEFGRMVIHPNDHAVAQASFDFLIQPENNDKSFSGPYRYKFANGKYAWGLGSVRILKYIESNGHWQFINILLPLNETMQLDQQIQSLIAENLRTGNKYSDKISTAEMRVLMMVGNGYENDVIAKTLNLSENTVHAHKNKLMKKLGIHSSVALASFAAKNGFV